MSCFRDELVLDIYRQAHRKLIAQWYWSMQVQAVDDALGEALVKWLRLHYEQRDWPPSKHVKFVAHWASDLLKDHQHRRKVKRKASRHVRVLVVVETCRQYDRRDWLDARPDMRQEDHVIAWLDRHVSGDMTAEPLPATWREAFDILRAAKWSYARIARLCGTSDEAPRQWSCGRCEPSPARQLLIEQAAAEISRTPAASLG